MVASMNWIQGLDRQQRQLLPEELEDYVTPDNLVRFIDAFTHARTSKPVKTLVWNRTGPKSIIHRADEAASTPKATSPASTAAMSTVVLGDDQMAVAGRLSRARAEQSGSGN
jgi:hypothetical protein